jgi:hypothetical protein
MPSYSYPADAPHYEPRGNLTFSVLEGKFKNKCGTLTGRQQHQKQGPRENEELAAWSQSIDCVLPASQRDYCLAPHRPRASRPDWFGVAQLHTRELSVPIPESLVCQLSVQLDWHDDVDNYELTHVT